MTESWTLAVARDDLSRTTLVRHSARDLGPGAALLRVDRVGMTANNVTYAVLGEALRYWRFFPPHESGLGPEWGLVPVWGFADVLASTVDGVSVGQRYYGFLPPAGHLVVRPDRVDERGFRDASEHRATLPSPYNAYRVTSGDPAYDAAGEDLLVLFRPLFYTSFMLADQIEDNDYYGADTIVISSASSKTAYGTAFELRRKGPRLVGLTSPGNVAFTRSLGCYDQVLGYDQVVELDPSRPAVYLDLSGVPALRVTLREHFGARLVRDVAVGLTNQVPNLEAAGDFFFAPQQIRKRSADWGRDGLDRRFAEAWRRFCVAVVAWIDITVEHGPERLRDAWLDTVAGTVPPRAGRIITFS